MLSEEFGRGAISVYSNAMEARVHFQQDVITKCANTIMDDQAWHQFTTIDHPKDFEELIFPNCLSFRNVLHGFLKPILSHMGRCADWM